MTQERHYRELLVIVPAPKIGELTDEELDAFVDSLFVKIKRSYDERIAGEDAPQVPPS